MTAFEAHDIEGLKAVLRADAVASMPPFAWRLAGAEQIAEAVGASDYCAGARLVPCRMNGAWGFGQYRPGDDDVLRPFALVAVEISGGRISRMVTFLGTQQRFREFGLPDSLAEQEQATSLTAAVLQFRVVPVNDNHRRRGRNPMRTPPSAPLTGETRAERERLAALFGGLSPEQWSAPSLCEGWRVRDAAAHITMPFRTTPLGIDGRHGLRLLLV